MTSSVLHQKSTSPRTSRKAIPLLGLGCPHCLRGEDKGDRPNPKCRQVREHKNTNKEDVLKNQLKGNIVVQGQAI
jgi:hypothetical protein